LEITSEKNSSFFSLTWMHQLHGHAGSKTLLQQNPRVLNLGWQLL